MSLIACSGCGQRPPQGVKLSQVTWAWVKADKNRTAYRQRLCVACFLDRVMGLDKPLTQPLTCPACGIETEFDFDAVYCTSFIPGTGKLVLEIPTCGPCAVHLRTRGQENAEWLPDRAAESRGLAPSTPVASDVWAALGITPRE